MTLGSAAEGGAAARRVVPGLRTSGRAGPRRAYSTIWRPDNRSGLGLRQGWTAHFLEKREKLWAFASVDTALLVLAV